jgi:hypothetical protein
VPIKHSTYLLLPVEVLYEILPAVMKDGDPWIPEQIDIQKVILNRKQRGKKINVVSMLDEGMLLALEDEIEEERNEHNE